MIEEYNNYLLEAVPRLTHNGRYSVAVVISKCVNNVSQKKIFVADDKIWYILEIEAVKESINFGKNLILRNMVGF
ncbi:MAG: hypothetical protein GY760_27055 [Deltaproteobacteria bacterium]|nr:hypothetical protein [Deltaproteobacteria bacterium]